MKKILAMTLALSITFGTAALPVVDEGITFDTGISASAEELISGDYKYIITNDDTIEITSYTGSSTKVDIPNTIDGKKVTKIDSSTFWGCSEIISITIPDNVISISSFDNCWNLAEINVNEGNENYSSSDGILFNKEKTEIIIYPEGKTDKTYKIPDGVTSISDFAFTCCKYLTSITMPDSVTSIGNGAFSDCSKLTDIKISDKVTKISDYSFDHCSSLTSVTIPYGVTYIGAYTFRECSNLMNVTMPDSINDIGEDAFYNTLLLNNQTDDIKYAGKWIIGCNNKITKADIKSDTVGIADYAFKNCSELTSIRIPDGVEIIGSNAFEGCSNLTSVIIPSSVKVIKSYPFVGCSNIKNIYYTGLKNKWEEIGFDEKLTSATMHYDYDPDWNTSGSSNNVNYDDFEYSTYDDHIEIVRYKGNDENVIIPDTIEGTKITVIGDDAFKYRDKIKNVTLSKYTTCIENYAFSECTELKSINIPEGVTYIGESAFSFCENLAEITIPSGVAYIGNSAFVGCKSINNVTIPGNISEIAPHLFECCSGLSNITISEGISSINEYAFNGCSNLKSITIPDSVTTINSMAFSDCSNLSEIIVKNNNNNYSSSDGALFNKDKTKLIFYFNGNKATNYTIPDNVKTIGEYAFFNCKSLTSITIPDNVTSIEKKAFWGCSGLTNITIPESISVINERTFCGCSSLEKITIPTSIESIEYEAFSGCEKLASVTIPGNVRSIKNGAFAGCPMLTNVIIQEGVESIGEHAFTRCFSPLLKNITIPKSVTSIGKNAFGYHIVFEVGDTKSDDFTINCYKGTAGEQYAKNNGFQYTLLDGESPHIHSYSDEWTIDKQPTATEPGSKSHHCTVCGDKKDVTEIPATGNNNGNSDTSSSNENIGSNDNNGNSDTSNGNSSENTGSSNNAGNNSLIENNVTKPAKTVKLVISKISAKSYTGKQVKPTVKIVVDGKTLKSGTDYTVKYGTNKIGKGTVKIVGKGKYAGKINITKTFVINPRKTSAKLKSTTGKVTVTLKKIKEAKKYQIQYATNKKFKGAKKITTTVVKKSFKAKSGKTYYVRVRSVNGKYVSGWSAVKKIKVK